MAENKKLIHAIICTGFVLVGFIVGFLIGMPRGGPEPEEITMETEPPAVEINAHATPEAEEPSPTPTPYVGTYYFVQSEEDSLNIYEVDGENKTLVKSAEVNLELFPASDKEALQQGVKVNNLEEGIQLIEDFTS